MNKVKFPLYEQLVEIATKTPTSDLDPQKMASLINSLEMEKLEVIQALIFHHYFTTAKTIDNKIPYGGTIFHGNRGVKYTISMLPDQLKSIIWTYLQY